MHAMILAAGLGTRLRPITDRMPKPMVPILGVPNIVRTILRLKNAGIEQIVINTHWHPEVLKQHLGNGEAFEVELHYSDEPILLGTGGGIKKALPLLGKEHFLVVNGDALFAPDFKRILRFHEERDAAATLVLRANPNKKCFGTVGIDGESRIRKILWLGEDKANLSDWMFCGVHVLSAPLARELPEEGCIVRTTYTKAVENGAPLFGIVDNSYFCDLGTKESYLDANLRLVKREVRLSGLTPPPDGVFIGENVHLGRECRLLPGTVLCDRAHIADGVTIENAVVLEDTRVASNIGNAIATPNGVL